MDNNLWIEYEKTKDSNIREQIIMENVHLVKYVAGRLNAHVGNYVDYEDLISYGILGLIDAIDKYDHKKGVKFETYASLRIRGEMIDNIRKLDWVPRNLRQKNKLLEQTCNDYEAQYGRQPTEEELAEILNVDIDEIQDMIKKSNISTLISLDDYFEQNYEQQTKELTAKNSETPEKMYENNEVRDILIKGIEELSEKQKTVISLYYFEGLTLREISRILEVSESRVSQIHSNSVRILKNKLGKYKSILFFN